MRLLASTYGWGEPLNPNNADGTRFDPMALTVAHRDLPFGTRLRIQNPRTGRSVVAIVRDRGPAASTGRSIDLSRGVAQALGFGKSVGPVDVQVLAGRAGSRAPSPAPPPATGIRPGTALGSPLAGSRFTLGGGPQAHLGNPNGVKGNWQSVSAYDLMVPRGTPVTAPFEGTVKVRNQGSSGPTAGWAVTIDSGHGLVAYLGHLSAANVRNGQKVSPGQRIGASGSANGAEHLHFALGRSRDAATQNGIDPLRLLERTSEKIEGNSWRGEGTPVIPTDDYVADNPPNLPGRDYGQSGGDEGCIRSFGVLGVDIPYPDPVCFFRAAFDQVSEWVVDQATLAMAYVALTVLGVWLTAQGAHYAFGSPAPADVVRSAGAAAGRAA